MIREIVRYLDWYIGKYYWHGQTLLGEFSSIGCDREIPTEKVPKTRNLSARYSVALPSFLHYTRFLLSLLHCSRSKVV